MSTILAISKFSAVNICLAFFFLLNDTLKAFEDSKNKRKMYEVMFFDMSKYEYSESVFNTLYIEIKHK